MENMYRLTGIVAIMIVFICGCSPQVTVEQDTSVETSAKDTVEQKPAEPCGFTLGIEQNGRRIPITASRKVTLDRAEFKLVFYFRQHGSMLVNASFSPDIVNKATSGDNLENILIPHAAIAENFGNEDKLLCIRDDGEYHNWVCIDQERHRFDTENGVTVIPEGYESGYLCRRTISVLDTADGTVDIQECPESVIYMLFAKTDLADKAEDQVDNKRECLEIHFRKPAVASGTPLSQ